MALLEATGLVKHFGRGSLAAAVAAVDGLSLTIERPGRAYGCVGPDGAGRTTAMRLMVECAEPGAGPSAHRRARPASGTELARSTIGYLPQHFSLYGDLTVYHENLAFFGSVRGIEAKILPGRARDLLGFVGLADFAARLASALSAA